MPVHGEIAGEWVTRSVCGSPVVRGHSHRRFSGCYWLWAPVPSMATLHGLICGRFSSLREIPQDLILKRNACPWCLVLPANPTTENQKKSTKYITVGCWVAVYSGLEEGEGWLFFGCFLWFLERYRPLLVISFISIVVCCQRRWNRLSPPIHFALR